MAYFIASKHLLLLHSIVIQHNEILQVMPPIEKFGFIPSGFYYIPL